MNVCFETFGCRLNRAEALDNEAQCLAHGHRLVTTHAEADIFIVRGCSVTARAQHDCEQMIRHLRRHYPNKRVIVMGCLPGAAKSLVLSASSTASETEHTVPTRTARAYLKVQDGCTGRCTFCIVPKFRGGSVSVPFDAVMAKAARFIDAGYHEIVVTGCNLSLYASQGRRLPELLAALAALSPGCRIRLGSLEPRGCADEVVDVMAENANLCRFLHLPVQSGSDRILKLMNRPYCLADVERIAEKARERMPSIALGCDMMTGFPGESEGDFMASRRFLSRLNFSNAHVFPYSERPGTAAADLPGTIPPHRRSERAHMLGNIAKANQRRFAGRFLRQEVEIIVESHGVDGRPRGWTGEYLWVEGPPRASVAKKYAWPRKSLQRFFVRSVDDGVLQGSAVDHGR